MCIVDGTVQCTKEANASDISFGRQRHSQANPSD